MAFRKTEDEKLAQREDQARQAYLASPVGQAEVAHREGQTFFQIDLDLSEVGGGFGRTSGFGGSSNEIRRKDSARLGVLGEIEQVGWHLEHAGYVFVETGSTSSNRIGSTGQGVVTRGKVLGIYLFRREA